MNELEKQSPAEETTREAVESCGCQAENETVKEEGAVCAESESPAMAMAEAADNIESKADLRRYHSMTKEQLVQAMRDILEAGEMNAHKDVAAIKQAFFLIKEKETKDELDAFVDAGNVLESFSATVDPAESELKEMLQQFREKRNAYLEEQEALQRRNLEAKKDVLAKLHTIADDIDNVNLHFPDFQKFQQEFKTSGDVPPGTENDLWREYQEVTEQFYDRLKMNKELRDLDFRKNLEMKRRLVEEAKALTEAKDRLAAFRRLQSIHQEWREIGPVAREFRESIWEEFKEASTTINRRHQEFFEARKAEERANEEAKTRLCEEVEAIDIDAISGAKAWDTTTAQVIDIQKRWRETGMASRKANSELLARFRKTCDLFFERKSEFFAKLKAEQAEAVARKKDLCARAEAQAEEENLSKAIETVKKLREEWKKSGHVGGRTSDVLWERFNKACDAVFERRRAVDADRRSEEEANLTAKRELIEKVRQIPLDGDRNEAITAVRALQDEWAGIGFVPFRHKEKTYKEYKEACDAVYDAYKTRERRDRAQRFERKVQEMKGDGSKIFSERERMLRSYDQKRGQLLTYENNMGFFNVKTSAGSAMIKDLERKIARIKEEMAELEEKIRLLDKAEA